MSTGGHATQQGQLDTDNTYAKNALGAYGNDIGSYMSNVNSTLAAGNPYQSKSFLTNQNLETSGAMNAANTKEGQQLRDSARRSGTNTAALAGTIASSAREGQRNLTDYNAARDNQNEDRWLQQQQGLMKDQLEGANSEAGVYGTSMGGANNSLNALTQREDSMDQMWGNLAGSVIGAGGTMGAAALKS
jgi:hypothetical protein